MSTWLLFSARFETSYKKFIKEGFYNKIRKTDYNAEGYLKGVEIRHQDYKELFAEFNNVPNVCFILDPPYLSTDCSTYTSYWKLKDYLDVLLCLRGTSYFYFTSDKSCLVELCTYFDKMFGLNNPFNDAKIHTKEMSLGKQRGYKDMMIYKNISNKQFALFNETTP